VPEVEYVDILKDRRTMAIAFMRDDCLDQQLRLRWPRDEVTRVPSACSHVHVDNAFAYRRSQNVHWPVSFCADCLTILGGRDPLMKMSKRPRWKFHERNVAVARWARDWPAPGRPRKRTPPLEVAWPDAA